MAYHLVVARYPAHKLEFLALKWAVTEKLQDYLYGSPFLAVTDSNPLTYVLTSAKLDATSYRWLAALSTFDFQLQYRAGKQNQDADGLSRRPHSGLADDHISEKEMERIRQFAQRHLSENEESCLIAESTVKAIYDKHLVHNTINDEHAEELSGTTLVLSLAQNQNAIPASYEAEEQFGGLPVIPHLTVAELVEKQKADTCIREVIHQIESGEKTPPSIRKELPEICLMLREWNRLELINGILYRRRQEGARMSYQLVLPEELRPSVLRSLHDDLGHMGIERTLDLVRVRFYWPKMSADVEQEIKTCNRCVRRKSLPERAAPLVNITATRPLELCMDFLSVEPDSSNTKDILVITDHFTMYAVAIPTTNQKAQTVAKCLWEHFFVHYGIPERLHSDQGRDFESRTIKELCELIGTQKIRTTPYHSRGNPVERFNRTLLNMLGTLENQKKCHWREHVRPLVHAYNCTKNDVTGFSPYELMFGRQPRLPVDLAFGLPVHHQPGSHSQYVQNLRSHLETSYRVASENAKKVADRNKTRFDKRVVESTLKEGDRVLVRNIRLRGKHKLADKWETDVYIVLRQSGDVPVYVVRPENGKGPQRTLHHDLLLPCGFLPLTPVEDGTNTQGPPRRPRTRQQPRQESCDGANENESQSDPDEYYHDGHRYLSVEAVDFNNISETTEQPLSEIEQEPLEMVSTIEQQSSDVAEAFPEDGPVETSDCDISARDPAESNLPDPCGNSPPAGQKPAYLPEQVLSVHSPTQATPEKNENESNINQSETEMEKETLRRSIRDRKTLKRLTYPELGNPLAMLVQSLFQSLTEVITDSLIQPKLQRVLTI